MHGVRRERAERDYREGEKEERRWWRWRERERAERKRRGGERETSPLLVGEKFV